MTSSAHWLKAFPLAFAGLVAVLPAGAETLRADVIVFLRPASAELPAAIKSVKPDDRLAIAIDDDLGLKFSGIKILPESEFGLAREWRQLKSKADYEPLLKLAFTEENPAASSGPALRLYQPVGDGSGLSGWLRLNASKTGSVQVDIEYVLPQQGQAAAMAYQVKQKRTASKPDATLYLDGGRLGMLVKLSHPVAKPVAVAHP